MSRISPLLRMGLPAAALIVLSAAAGAAGTTVTTRQVDDLKAVFAVVDSVKQATARARISGTIDEPRVREGDRVTAGQVLAVVRDPKLSLQLTAFDAQLASLQAQAKQAEQELDRAQSLRTSGAGSQQKLDDARTQLDVATAKIAAMRADRAVVERQLKEGEILAPSSGRVLKVPMVAGGVIQTGETAATIAQDNFILRLKLPERHARFLHAGDPVLVGERGLSPEEDATKAARGTVRLVYPELENGQVVADAEVAGLGDYYVGERVRVLVSSGKRDVIVLPRSAVVRRAGVDFVTLADGRSVPVQTGRENGDGVEILSGLRPGDVTAEGGK